MKKIAIALIGFLITLNLAAQNTATPTYDFTPASAAINTAIAQKKLPGAVLIVGHDGKIVFHHAYGVRKYAGEPGLDGKPSPAEPMTEDTIFDMASLTKCLATATAIMQLVEQGKVDVDAPVVKYLPDFAGTSNANSAVAPNGNSTPSTNASPATTLSANGQTSKLATNSTSATTLSANGATTYQPRPKAQVPVPDRDQRAEGPTHSPFDKSTVTVRELLTHYSGLPEDVSLKDPWGLAAPDKAEGIRRAMNAELRSVPGTKFVYSDINFITLGAIVEKIAGQPLDVYAKYHIFIPLGMTETNYWPNTFCGNSLPAYGHGLQPPPPNYPTDVICTSPRTRDLFRTAPTQHDNEGTPETNPDFDHLLRGTVHDPTTRRMGGVAGHAGVFSTAGDVAKYAQALLDKLLYNRGPFPLKQSTLKLMTTPEQPATAQPGATIFTADGKPTTGIAARGFGWDINSAFSRPRGEIFPTVSPDSKWYQTPSFGHTGFTGTSLWIDPDSDTYIVLLANSVHPRGASPISPLRGEVATAVAKALHLECSATPKCAPVVIAEGPNAGAPSFAPAKGGLSSEARPLSSTPPENCHPERSAAESKDPDAACTTTVVQPIPTTNSTRPTLTGIDVLESTNFAALKDLAAKHNGHLRIGLLTNQTGVDSHGHRTIDILRTADPSIQLTALFSPEHGIFGAKDSEVIGQETDPASGLRVTSLYGPKDSDKRPKPEDLAPLDAVVIDLQDAGVHFYTYESVVGYFLEAAACEAARAHPLEIIVLDRPALTGGLAVQGPVSDTAPSYINYMPTALRNGMTLGELAQYMRSEHPGSCAIAPAVRSSSGLAQGFSPGSQAVDGSSHDGASAPGSSPAGSTSTQVTQGFSLGPQTAQKNDGDLAPGSSPAGSTSTQVTQGFSLGPQTAQKNDGALAPGSSPAGSTSTQVTQGFSLGPQSAPKSKGALAPGVSSATPAHLTVIKMQNWNRAEFYDQTGLPWINPSPNLRNIQAATLYPGVGMLDYANISVGRGTTTPFEVFGAGTSPVSKTAPAIPAHPEKWIDGKTVAAYLTARQIPGVTFTATTFPVAETSEHYPYHGQTIEGVKLTVTDRLALDSPELGIEILSALHHLYPTQFKLEKVANLVANAETMAALARDEDPRAIAASWAPALAEFKSRRAQYLLYP